MPRSIYSTDEKNKLSILYQATISEDIRCLHCYLCCAHPCSCLFVPLVSHLAREASYVHVQENRIEYNIPLTTVTWNCDCHVIDDVRVIYFDRDQFEEVYALNGCCCGYDKTVVLRQPCTKCSMVKGGCCGRMFIPCVDDPDALVNTIKDHRSSRLRDIGLVEMIR